MEDDRLEKTNPFSAAKTYWGGRIAKALCIRLDISM